VTNVRSGRRGACANVAPVRLFSLHARSSRLTERTVARGFRLAVGARHSVTALLRAFLRAAFTPLPLPNGQTEAQITDA
jgi:hypothetical protein